MAAKFSEVSFPQIDIRREEKVTKSHDHCESATQTESIKSKESSCEPMEKAAKGTQTEAKEEKNKGRSATDIKIQEKILDLIISSHLECEKHWDSMSKLDQFHERRGLEIQQTHNFQLPLSLADASVVGISCASAARRCVILFGETSHDEWCSHQGLSTQHPLAVCPSAAAWLSSTVFVGDVAGTVHVYSNEKHITSNDLHSNAITCLNVSSHGLLSTSTDGIIRLSSFKSNSLSTIKEIKLNNSNLSRNICRQTTVNKAVCIADLHRNKNEVCMGSETGGIWLLTMPDLELRILPFPPQAIEHLLYYDQSLAICDNSSITFYSLEGERKAHETMEVKCAQRFESLYLFSSGTELLVYESSSAVCVSRISMLSRLFSISAPSQTLCCLTNNALVTYQISVV